MKAEEAAQLIRAMADSIAQDPGQFTFIIQPTGVRAEASEGGIGMIGYATTGGTGVSGKASSGNVSIERGEAAANASRDEAVEALREIAQLAETGAGQETLREKLQRLNEIAVMPTLAINASGLALRLSELI